MSRARSINNKTLPANSGNKSEGRRTGGRIDTIVNGSDDDLKKLATSDVLNISEYVEKTKADIKKVLDDFDVPYGSKTTKPELLELLEKALLSKYKPIGNIAEKSPKESKSVGQNVQSGTKANKPTVTFHDSQRRLRGGDATAYQLRSRDRSLTTRKMQRSAPPSHIASNDAVCIRKGERVVEVDDFLFYPAKGATKHSRSPSASSTKTRKSRTRSAMSSPSGSESALDISNRIGQSDHGALVATDEVQDDVVNNIDHTTQLVRDGAPYTSVDRNDGDDNAKFSDEDDHRDVDEDDEDEFYDAADGSFLMDTITPDSIVANAPLQQSSPLPESHQLPVSDDGEQEQSYSHGTDDYQGVDDGEGESYHSSVGHAHAVLSQQTEDENVFDEDSGDGDDHRDEDGGEVTQEVDQFSDKGRDESDNEDSNDARIHANEYQGVKELNDDEEDDVVMDDGEFESISDEDEWDDDGAEDSDADEEDYDMDENEPHGDGDVSLPSRNPSNEVIDLLSSDDDELPAVMPDGPAPSRSAVTAVSETVAVSVDAAVGESVVVQSTRTEGDVTQRTQTAVDHSGSSTTLISAPPNSEVAKLETVLNKLTKTFVAAVSSSIAATDDHAGKLSAEDYHFLKSILEKTKPGPLEGVSHEVDKEQEAVVHADAAKTKRDYFIDTTRVDESDTSKRKIKGESYSIYASSSSQAAVAVPIQPDAAKEGKKTISFGEHDAIIPRSSFDGKSWSSRESFLPNTPSTPAHRPSASSMDERPFNYQKDLFNAAIRLPTPYYAAGSNKRSAFDAGFPDSNITNAGSTPFSRSAPHSSGSFHPTKRMSFDGYSTRDSTPGALQLSTTSSLSRFQSRGIGTGEVASSGLVPFQGRPSYTPTFRGTSVQFPKSVTVTESSEAVVSANTGFNSGSSNVSAARSLSYIQRRRLQRDSISSQSAAMAQKILQTLSGITSPIEQQRRKPIAITWRDELVDPSPTSMPISSTLGPQSAITFTKADNGKDISRDQGVGASELRNGTKGSQLSLGANLQSPFLHSSLRQKPSIADDVAAPKNYPLQQKGSVSLPSGTDVHADVTPKAAVSDHYAANINNTIMEDREFTFKDPLTVNGVEDDDADILSTGEVQGGRAIKYMFSSCKSKTGRVGSAIQTPQTQHHKPISAAAVESMAPKSVSSVTNDTSSPAPTINIWAASSINDGIKCKVCLSKNKKEAVKCASCESPLEPSLSTKSTSAPPSASVAKAAATPSPAVPNIWALSSINDGIKCKVCLSKNKKEAMKCASCESPLDAVSGAGPGSAVGADTTKPLQSGFTFGAGPSADASTDSKKVDLSGAAQFTPTGFSFPASSSKASATTGFNFTAATTTQKPLISDSQSQVKEPATSTGFTFNASSFGTTPTAVQFGTTPTPMASSTSTEDTRRKVSFNASSTSSNDNDIGSNDESGDQPFKRKMQRGVSDTLSAFKPPAFDGGFTASTSTTSKLPEPFLFGGSSATTQAQSATPLFAFNAAAPTAADAPKPFAFGVRPTSTSHASEKETATTAPTTGFKFDGPSADQKSNISFGMAATPTPSAQPSLNLPSTAVTPAVSLPSASSAAKPFVFGSSDAQSSVKPFTFNTFGSSKADGSSATTSSFTLPAAPVLPISTTTPLQPFALVPSSSSSAGKASDAFSFGSTAKSQPTVTFNASATTDSKSAVSTASPFSASAFGASTGKPPLASVNPFGASSLLFSSNGVAAVDQPAFGSGTAGTISPVPTFGASVAGSNLVSADSPGSTMDVGSIGSHASAPSAQALSATASGPFSATASGPFSATASGPFSATTSGPFSASASGPFSATTSGPFSATASGPFSSSAAFSPASFSFGGSAPQANVFASNQSMVPKDVSSFGSNTQLFGLQQQPSSGAFGQEPFGGQQTGFFGQQPSGSFGQQPTSTPFGQQPSSSGFSGQQPGIFGQQQQQQPSSGSSSAFSFSPAGGSMGSLPFSGSANALPFPIPGGGSGPSDASGFSLGTSDKQQGRRKVKVKR